MKYETDFFGVSFKWSIDEEDGVKASAIVSYGDACHTINGTAEVWRDRRRSDSHTPPAWRWSYSIPEYDKSQSGIAERANQVDIDTFLNLAMHEVQKGFFDCLAEAQEQTRVLLAERKEEKARREELRNGLRNLSRPSNGESSP